MPDLTLQERALAAMVAADAVAAEHNAAASAYDRAERTDGLVKRLLKFGVTVSPENVRFEAKSSGYLEATATVDGLIIQSDRGNSCFLVTPCESGCGERLTGSFHDLKSLGRLLSRPPEHCGKCKADEQRRTYQASLPEIPPPTLAEALTAALTAYIDAAVEDAAANWGPRQ